MKANSEIMLIDTSITGLYCHSLLKAFQWTAEPLFRDQAVAYLKAYATFWMLDLGRRLGFRCACIRGGLGRHNQGHSRFSLGLGLCLQLERGDRRLFSARPVGLDGEGFS